MVEKNLKDYLNPKEKKVCKPIIREAIFSDGTKHYVSPQEPMEFDYVKVRCRVAKGDADKVTLVINTSKVLMNRKKSDTDTLFDYYEGSFLMGNQRVTYCFEIQKGEEVLFYNQMGVMEEKNTSFDFHLIPGYKTPDWAKGAVFYQIFVDRFADGDLNNNVEDREYCYIGEPVTEVTDWGKYPASMGVREFYGGDLKGVMSKLDYLQDLGVEVIYLNPIFVSPSNHKYDTQDYDYIDPHFTVIKNDGGDVLEEGDFDNSHATKYIQRVTNIENLEASNRFFAKFTDEIHARGMKIILDGVFNHCGSFNKWLDRERIYEEQSDYEKGAYVDKNSPYRSFFNFREDDWPYNIKYDGWWGHDTLPKLNYEETPKLFSYIMRIAKKWISPPYNVDGWRLDVAADLGNSLEYNHYFWKEFRRVVKEANPEALILAEHYGDVTPWVSGGEWDTVMNYDAFMEPLTWFLTGMEKHSDVFRGDLLGNTYVFWEEMKKYSARFTNSSLQVAMNELSNHDHSRFLTRTNHTVGRVSFMTSESAGYNIQPALMMAAVIFQMTWVGAPTVYYGDEVGVCGWTDPDNRRTYPWGNENKEMLFCHKEMIRIHKDYNVLKVGSFIPLYNEEYGLISYGRFDKEDQIAVAIYIGGEEKEIWLPVWKMGMPDGSIMVRVASSNEDGFTLETEIVPVRGGCINIKMKPKSAVVYKNFSIA